MNVIVHVPNGTTWDEYQRMQQQVGRALKAGDGIEFKLDEAMPVRRPIISEKDKLDSRARAFFNGPDCRCDVYNQGDHLVRITNPDCTRHAQRQ